MFIDSVVSVTASVKEVGMESEFCCAEVPPPAKFDAGGYLKPRSSKLSTARSQLAYMRNG
jgi:hypothetical protein